MTHLPNANSGAPSRQGAAQRRLDFPRSEFVQSLERGLAVIKCFDAAHPERTLADIANAVGMTRAAARRFVLTLQALGYVEANGRLFRLRAQTLELGYAYLASLPWWRHAQQVADRVATDLGHACAVGVLERDLTAYVAYSSPAPLANVVRSVGTRLPAFATAIGRVLLANLPAADFEAYRRHARLLPFTPFTLTTARELKAALEVCRQAGYAVEDQQLEIAMRSVAVPVYERHGRVMAAIGVSLRDPYAKLGAIERKSLPVLRAAAAEITKSLPS